MPIDGPNWEKLFHQGRLTPSVPEHRRHIESYLKFYEGTPEYEKVAKPYIPRLESEPIVEVVPEVTEEVAEVIEDPVADEVVEGGVEEVAETPEAATEEMKVEKKKRGRPRKVPPTI